MLSLEFRLAHVEYTKYPIAKTIAGNGGNKNICHGSSKIYMNKIPEVAPDAPTLRYEGLCLWRIPVKILENTIVKR